MNKEKKRRNILLKIPKETLVDLVLAGDKIEDNWNELKEWLKEKSEPFSDYDEYDINRILDKIQELEDK